MSCNENEEIINQVQMFETNEDSFLQKIGVVLVSKINNGEYKLYGCQKIINDTYANLENYIVKLKLDSDGYEILSLINPEYKELDFKFAFKDCKIIDFKTKKVVDENYLSDSDKNNLVFIISVIYTEIKKNEFTKEFKSVTSKHFNDILIEARQDINTRSACNRTISSIQYTRSRTEASLILTTRNFLSSHTDCRHIYGMDSGCLWGDYGCVATQEIECSGSTCSESSWQIL